MALIPGVFSIILIIFLIIIRRIISKLLESNTELQLLPIEYIVHNGLMKDLSVLQDAPFTDNGSIVEVFTDLTVWFGIKNIIDRINANALAA